MLEGDRFLQGGAHGAAADFQAVRIDARRSHGEDLGPGQPGIFGYALAEVLDLHLVHFEIHHDDSWLEGLDDG